MPTLPWHDALLLVSCFTSAAGLWFFCRSPLKDPTEAEAAQETLVRLSFVYWIVYCFSHWSEQFILFSPELTCSLRMLTILSYLLTFCCLLSLPLHLIEQRNRQPN